MSGMNRAKNKSQKLAGMAKEAIGKATGDKSTENEGKRDQAKANLKDAGVKVREAGEKVADIFKSDPCGETVKDAGEKVREAGEKVREAGEKAGESLANIFTSDEKVKDAGGEAPPLA